MHTNVIYPLFNTLGSYWQDELIWRDREDGIELEASLFDKVSATPIEAFDYPRGAYTSGADPELRRHHAIIGGHGGRIEFADRRMMSHLHELSMLPDAPDAETKLEAIFECGTGEADLTQPNRCPSSRKIVQWVADNLGLTAIHSARCRDMWPEPEGALSKEEKNTLGYIALSQTFANLEPEVQRRVREIGIENYALLHGPCDSYCLRDVKDHDGNPTGKQRCRMRAELKEQFCCDCLRCAPCSTEDGVHEDVPPIPAGCDESCRCNGYCKTTVWRLPDTFRFELRICRRHARIQVHPTASLSLNTYMHMHKRTCILYTRSRAHTGTCHPAHTCSRRQLRHRFCD